MRFSEIRFAASSAISFVTVASCFNTVSIFSAVISLTFTSSFAILK
uniref:Uncharacterized protein n=1 Tax=virus sp. ct9pU4 TaxID=2828248 RepID=A0A8S5RAM9_9VIRU|nr:MAG TPA: hypothetical protein [virus sp. ct9pU4]